MTRLVYLSEEQARQDFAQKAAAHFASHPEHWSFSAGEIEPGALLALRWGLHDRAVLVLKVADDIPTIYMDLVPRA